MDYFKHVAPILGKEAGERLKLARTAHRLSQQQVSKKAGVSQGYLSKLEKGVHTYATFPCSVLYDLFGEDAHFIITGEGELKTPLPAKYFKKLAKKAKQEEQGKRQRGRPRKS